MYVSKSFLALVVAVASVEAAPVGEAASLARRGLNLGSFKPSLTSLQFWRPKENPNVPAWTQNGNTLQPAAHSHTSWQGDKAKLPEQPGMYSIVRQGQKHAAIDYYGRMYNLQKVRPLPESKPAKLLTDPPKTPPVQPSHDTIIFKPRPNVQAPLESSHGNGQWIPIPKIGGSSHWRGE